VLTAFVIESYQNLSPDTSQASLQALYRISLQISNSSVPALADPSSFKFKPESSDVWINALWFTSLVVALVSALVAIFVKQWAREYLSWTAASAGRKAVAVRQYRSKAWTDWGVKKWRDLVIALLQLALILFFSGLVILLWNLNGVIAGLVTATAGAGVGCVGLAISLPAVWTRCPYRNPLSWTWRRAAQISGLTTASETRAQQQEHSSWVLQDVSAMQNKGDIDQNASEGVLAVLKAHPSWQTLDRISPLLLIGSDMGDGFHFHWQLQSLWAMIEIVLNVSARLDTGSKWQDYSQWCRSASPVSKDLARRISALAREALFMQPSETYVLDAINLVHFVTAMVTESSDGSLHLYHVCTLARLLSDHVPRSLREAAFDDFSFTMTPNFLESISTALPAGVFLLLQFA
jgi:hypothetical protein